MKCKLVHFASVASKRNSVTRRRTQASLTTDLHLVGAGNKVQDTSSHKLHILY